MPFNVPRFRPHPLVRGGHLQTIVASYWPGGPRDYLSTLLPVALPDGDVLAVHDDGPDSGWPGVLLVHGLAGCHQSGYMVRCSAKLRSRGMRVFRMDLRGCGAGFSLAKQPLHAGRSEDVAAVLGELGRRCPGMPIHMVGFSMGGNIVLKLAGEMGDAAPPHLASVMAVAPPIDLAACCQNIQRGLNRAYDRRFVRALLCEVRRREAQSPDTTQPAFTAVPRQLMEFDAVYTAPRSGFNSVEHYYASASSGSVLHRIGVPTLIVAAASDPIVPVSLFERASYSSRTETVIAPCGGHLGFIAARGTDPDCRWLDWRVVDWVQAQAATMSAADLQEATPPQSLPVVHDADQRPVKGDAAAVV
jgi:predicted alpha/beta-fold hydrolase